MLDHHDAIDDVLILQKLAM